MLTQGTCLHPSTTLSSSVKWEQQHTPDKSVRRIKLNQTMHMEFPMDHLELRRSSEIDYLPSLHFSSFAQESHFVLGKALSSKNQQQAEAESPDDSTTRASQCAPNP